MKRARKAGWLILSSVAIVCLALLGQGSAQLAVRLTGPDGQTYDVTGRNVARGDEALVLYDGAFGKTTRTNPYGVEVMAVPSAHNAPQGVAYQVTAVTSVWECQKQGLPNACGNAVIPDKGIVVSATGAKRDVLKALKPGDTLILQEEWFHQKQVKVDVVNPSPENNPNGSGFPGYRASNQVLIYDIGYGKPTTGTNEFGFEVTVQNGVVTAQEGSDSTIPSDGYVISGHGRGRNWLIANAPVGAKMFIDPANSTLRSTIDFETYQYQFDRRWENSPCVDALRSQRVDQVCQTLGSRRNQALQLAQGGRAELAAATMLEALEGLNRRLWLSYEPFPAATVRGAWHRPVEKNAAAIGQTLDNLKAAGLNTVFLETFFHGYTIFPSKTYESYGLPNQNPKFAGADILKLWVEQAHQRGMRVHVWFQTFYGGTKAYMPPGPILEKYPEWANVQFSALKPEQPPEKPEALATGNAKPKNGPAVANGKAKADAEKPVKLLTPDKPVPSSLELGGYFLDPANPAVQSFLLKLAEEIATRYDIDGFQLDYIRYPASFPSDRFSFRKTTWGYTNIARNSFKSRYFADPAEIDPKDPKVTELWKNWADFKTEQINRFVERATTMLRTRRPDLKISAAVFPEADAALSLKHQDWRTWSQRGWVDFYAPMTLTSAVKIVERDTRYMVNVTGGKIPIYSGIFGPFNDNTAEHVLSQMDIAKRAGASGYVLFDTAHLTARMLEALKTVQVPEPVVAPAVVPAAPVASPNTQKPAQKKRRWFRK